MNIRTQILERIERANDLPTLPAVAIKISDLVNRQNSSAADIACVMEHDPVLTARILKVANSVAFGFDSPTTSVQHAVSRLGIRNIRDLTLSLSVIRLFSNDGLLDYPRFWRHSLSVGFTAHVFNQYAATKVPQTDALFAAGILHDIGVLLLDQYARTAYRRVVQSRQNGDRELQEVELECLGIDHAELGSKLLERWHLPDAIVQAARCHHCLEEASPDVLRFCQIVHLANFACNNQGVDNGLGTFPSGFSESAWYDVRLSLDDVPDIIAHVNREMAKSELLLAVAYERECLVLE